MAEVTSVILIIGDLGVTLVRSIRYNGVVFEHGAGQIQHCGGNRLDSVAFRPAAGAPRGSTAADLSRVPAGDAGSSSACGHARDQGGSVRIELERTSIRNPFRFCRPTYSHTRFPD